MNQDEYKGYKDFKSGLFIKYHLVYLKSLPFIKFSVYHSDFSATFELPIALKVDAEKMLAKIKEELPYPAITALCLAAQGYMQWEIGELIGRSERTVRRYMSEAKKIIFDN